MSWERCVAVRTQEVTFDSQLKSHTGEPFNFQATSLNCLCCCSSTFIVRTWLNRAGGAWRARGTRGSLQFLATIESKHIFKKSTIIWRNLPLSLEFDIWSSKNNARFGQLPNCWTLRRPCPASSLTQQHNIHCNSTTKLWAQVLGLLLQAISRWMEAYRR